jgi:hypothetical protein
MVNEPVQGDPSLCQTHRKADSAVSVLWHYLGTGFGLVTGAAVADETLRASKHPEAGVEYALHHWARQHRHFASRPRGISEERNSAPGPEVEARIWGHHLVWLHLEGVLDRKMLDHATQVSFAGSSAPVAATHVPFAAMCPVVAAMHLADSDDMRQ